MLPDGDVAPAAQAWQFVKGFPKKPGAQKHANAEELPVGEVAPGMHEAHVVAAFKFWYVPLGHAAHAEAPEAAAKLLGSHKMHSVVPVSFNL